MSIENKERGSCVTFCPNYDKLRTSFYFVSISFDSKAFNAHDDRLFPGDISKAHTFQRYGPCSFLSNFQVTFSKENVNDSYYAAMSDSFNGELPTDM